MLDSETGNRTGTAPEPLRNRTEKMALVSSGGA